MPEQFSQVNPAEWLNRGAANASASEVGMAQKVKNYLGSTKGKVGVGSLLGWLALGSVLNSVNEAKNRGVQREALRSQAEMATPENLYYQAALPKAQAEESQARQALLAHLSGGVLGPSLAKGERIIGG